MATSTQTVTTLSDMALLLLALPLFGLGWLAGVIVRCVLWVTAAIVAGFRSGMGE